MDIEKLAKDSDCKDWNKYRPMRDIALVLDDPKDDKTENGIWLPPKHRQGRWIYAKGTVVCVGPGRSDPKSGKRLLPPVKAGQRVMYLDHYGTLLEKLSGNEQFLRMLDPEQIIGIVVEE